MDHCVQYQVLGVAGSRRSTSKTWSAEKTGKENNSMNSALRLIEILLAASAEAAAVEVKGKC